MPAICLFLILLCVLTGINRSPNHLDEKESFAMKPLTIVGVLLIAAGIAGLALGRFSYVTETKVMNLGPLTASVDEVHSVAIPDIAGVAAIAVGLVLIVLARRST